MKFLKEGLEGPSELDNFVYMLDEYYSTYYVVRVVELGGKLVSEDFFSNEEDAREFFNEKKEEVQTEPSGYFTVTVAEVKVTPEEDDLDEFTYDADEEKQDEE